MKAGMELPEEAIELLRRAPSAAWVWYLAGAVPFFGAALVFWYRMTGATAVPNPLSAAFVLALLFGWRQYARARFAAELHGLLSGADRSPHSLKALAAVWLAGIVRLPLLIVPFPALIALFRNVPMLAWRESKPFTRAATMATIGSEQITALLTVAGASFVLWLNFFTGMLLLPALFRMLTGEDFEFLRNSGAYAGSTVTFASLTVGWCLTDAVLASFYALRLFYGEAQESGADLLSRWRRAVARVSVVAAILVCVLPVARAADTPLRRAADQVLTEAPYQWREPLPEAKDQNAFVRWTDRLFAGVQSAWDWCDRQVNRFFRWLRDLFRSGGEPKPGDAPPTAALSLFAWLAIATLAGAVLVAAFRSRLLRRGPAKTGSLPAAPPPIDLEDPGVIASQLPESEWIAMARDLAARGDYRTALRAWFLASLAYLASREMLVVARSKTNLDYLSEVRRRSRSVAGLEPLFATAVRSFESAWYGLHEVDGSEVEGFAANFERMRSLAGGAA